MTCLRLCITSVLSCITRLKPCITNVLSCITRLKCCITWVLWYVTRNEGDCKICVFAQTTFHSLCPLFFPFELSGKAADSYSC